jgi:adenine-specific DNA-methyltransferase
MVEWVLAQYPDRIIDAGCGSGRFTLAVARRSGARIVALDTDPLSTLLTRAALATIGNSNTAVLNCDYTQAVLPAHQGKTAFVGNPPYVRHHSLSTETKSWAPRAATRAGVPISGLAGLHAYFFLATALHGRDGDVGCFITSSEWLDVNHGEVIRRLLLDGLGGQAIHVLPPKLLPFDSTATTSAVTCFQLGSRPSSIKLRMVNDATGLAPLTAGRPIARERLNEARRWLPLIRSKQVIPEGFVELGELCRVHRGAVTGSNATWIVRADSRCQIPERYQFPSITRARELIRAGERLDGTRDLRRVIDLPVDLDELDSWELRIVERFLTIVKASGAADGYVAQNRKAWWSVGLREPAPILATYMARRAPAFVRNVADARINIAHGVYPMAPLPDYALDRLATALRGSDSVDLGRTYAGGLVKFEPREMERIPVPSLERLLEH